MAEGYEPGAPGEEKLGEAFATYRKAFEAAMAEDREPPDLEEFLKDFSEDVQREYEIWKSAQEPSEIPGAGWDGCPTTDVPFGSDSVLRITQTLAFKSLYNPNGSRGLIYRFHDEDLKRDLALKVKRSTASKDRFRREARITAKLDHPAIVPVFGIGETDQGAPCYATKLVQGNRTLLDEIGRFHGGKQKYRSLEFRRILSHFITACDAVSHAHLNLHHHGDLKPEHIVIELSDGSDENSRQRIYVVDWGLAEKAAGRDTQEGKDLLPGDSNIEGTPEYMSPEMARGEPGGFASDIYALGVTLYVILTAQTPFVGNTVHEILYNVQRREGFQPPRHVDHRIPRALQAVCLKAMAANPKDRYPSIKEMGDDIERWLAGDKPLAHHEILGEGVWRWADRHQRAAVLALMVVITGVIAIAWQWRVAVQERRMAYQACDLLNELVTTPARNGIGRENAVSEALDRIVPDIARRFGRNPEIEAKIREMIASTYRLLGKHAKGEPHAQRALDLRLRIFGADHRDTITTEMNLAGLLSEAGRLDEAEKLMRQNLATCGRVLSPDDRDFLIARANLGELLWEQGKLTEAESLLRGSLNSWRRVAGDNDPETLTAVNNLAVLIIDQGKLSDAKKLLDENMNKCKKILGHEHPQTLMIINNLCYLQLAINGVQTAEAQLRRNLAVTDRVMGRSHPYTVTALGNMILWCQWNGNATEAIEHAQRRWEALRQNQGPARPKTLDALDLLVKLLLFQERYNEAEPLSRELVAQSRTVNPAKSLELADALFLYGWSLLEINKAATAKSILEESLTIRREKLGADHWRTANVKSALAGCLTSLGRYEQAEPLLVESYPIIASSMEAPSIHKDRALERIIALYDAWGKPERAKEWRSKRSQKNHPTAK